MRRSSRSTRSIVTAAGDLLALDAKMTFDDNALYRHADIREFRDLAEEDPLEIEASKYSLNYIRLDGSIGCMVNGAGLAMATMDIIKLAGGEPANFLDVGGGANAEQIRNAFKILMADANVKAVLINIFGGILRCDVLASGVIAAVKELDVKVPIVVRMEGTNVEEGKRMLAESGLNFASADGMGDAATKVVALAKGGVASYHWTPWPFFSTSPRVCSCRASPAARERSTPSRPPPTARPSSAASRRARAARRTRAGRYSTPARRR